MWRRGEKCGGLLERREDFAGVVGRKAICGLDGFTAAVPVYRSGDRVMSGKLRKCRPGG
jgi:hypothetical protein